MTPITLQIALPDALELSAAELVTITGRKTARTQMEWLDANAWEYTLDADKGILVGKLYAHLRLAGLHPAGVTPRPAGAGGFNMDATR
jgi:uncharacterized protein DUF4224